jgi:sialate O-acetylesterase
MRIPHTGMVVVTDLVDDLFDFHPRDKKDVGERLAAWALTNDYGRKGIEVSGPLFHSMDVDGNKAVLHFDHLGGGLISKDGLPLSWFDVAGADGRFYPGTATIEGDTVVVTAPQVAAPAGVHFAWDEGARANLANKAGLPASPFRTDNPFLQISGAETGGP